MAHLQPLPADANPELAEHFAIFERIEAIAVLCKVVLDAGCELLALGFADGAGQVLDDFGIGIQPKERFDVGLTP